MMRTATLFLMIVAGPALAEAPRTAADCHAPTRHETNEKGHALAALEGIALEKHRAAQNAERDLHDKQREHHYNYRNISSAERDELLALAHAADDTQTAYLQAQLAYTNAKIADVQERQKIQECLDDVADAEDARRAAKGKSKSK